MGAGERKNRSYALDRYPDLKEQKLKEQQALNKMLGVNLSTVPTSDLVRELCSREGVAEITLNRNDSCSSRCYGPGKILWVPDIIVVRGDE